MLTESKRECSRGIFHAGAARMGSIVNRSETIKLGKGCRSEGGVGENEVMVRIQGELQIEREEELWILLQAPLEMK
jgi:hypothetical protein